VVLLYSIYYSREICGSHQRFPLVTKDRKCIGDWDCISGSTIVYTIVEKYVDPQRFPLATKDRECIGDYGCNSISIIVYTIVEKYVDPARDFHS
jgi:hypothetical protein